MRDEDRARMWKDWSQPTGDSLESTANWYRWFAEECDGQSPLYASLSAAVAEDRLLLELIAGVGRRKRQPNLWFAATHYLAGTEEYPPDIVALRRMWRNRADEMLALVSTRSTQTNEVGRCATLLPALSLIEGPIALLEVGTSGGLCLLPDRYRYEYSDGVAVGDEMSPVRLRCEVRGTQPLPPVRVPEVVWRAGLDLAPIDITDDDAVAWLQACVWPDQPDRQERLAAAVDVARRDPPTVVVGDLVDDLADVAESAPDDATLVLFHSAVLPYVRLERQRNFASTVANFAARRPLVWLANEGPGVMEAIFEQPAPPAPKAPTFAVTRVSADTPERLALTHPHGAWLEWGAPA
jgi:hypothetical protein